MKKIIIYILATTLLGSIIIILMFAQTASAVDELPATPSVLSEPSATLLITEISFKNKENDFAVITYSSPSEKPANLKNITIKDDGTVVKIEEDFFVASGQQILLTWDSDQENSAPYLYSTKKGLTGTTEQLIIYDNNDTILDMVCWTNDSPTETEIEDFTEAYENDGWASNDINSCIPSEQIGNNESIKRKENTDTNSLTDWELPIHAETEQEKPKTELTSIIIPQNNDETEQSTTELITNNSKTNQATDSAIINPKLVSIETPKTELTASSTKTQNSESETSSKYRNGNLSQDIIISEIFPNPDGTDAGKEWIELFNSGTETINLGNWQLDDNEEGSKPFHLPDNVIIESGKTLLIDCKKAKLSLGNTEDSVRLFDYTGKLISETQYENAPSDESYSLINIIDEEEEITAEYQWTKNKTPNAANPTYNSYVITIETEPVFEKEYFFTAKTTTEQIIKIIFTEDIIAAPLAKATFSKDTTVQVVVEEINDEDFRLISYQTIGSETFNQKPSNMLLSIFLGFAVISGAAIYFVTKKMHWQSGKNTI